MTDHCCSHCATPGRFPEDDDREHLCEICAAIKHEEQQERRPSDRGDEEPDYA